MKLKVSQSGLTIIETMIVLAVASLIITGVLVAAQGLNRAARNSARTTDVGQIIIFLNDYKAWQQRLPVIPTADTMIFESPASGDKHFEIAGQKSADMHYYNQSGDNWLLMAKKGVTEKNKVSNSVVRNELWDSGQAATSKIEEIKADKMASNVGREGLIVILEQTCSKDFLSGSTNTLTSIMEDNSGSFLVLYSHEGSDNTFCSDS